jgi:hypothetical protein
LEIAEKIGFLACQLSLSAAKRQGNKYHRELGLGHMAPCAKKDGTGKISILTHPQAAGEYSSEWR